MKLSLRLRPSLLGQYYEKQCDKFLVYNSVDKTRFKKLGWVEPEKYKQNAAALAGNEWEKILYDRLVQDGTCEIINLKQDEEHVANLAGTVDVLKGLSEQEKPVYLYQACFSITPSFSKKYLASFDEEATKAFFSERMYPDFIKAEYMHSEGKYRLTIIDAKNAGNLKVGAEIQISLYVLILKAIIKDEGIANCYVNEDEGIVWNREKITDNKLEHIFKIQDAEVVLNSFFEEKLPDICKVIDESRTGSQIQKKLQYRISQKCEYCDNFETCKNHCIDEGNVRLMPYITAEAQNRLDELIADGTLADDTFESVKAVLENEPDLLTEDCSYWKNIKNNLEAYEKGLLSYFEGEKERFPKVGSSISFPIGQNYSLLLTAQQDVNSGRSYAYAWLLKPGYGLDVWGQGLGKNGFVAINEGKDGCPGKGTYYDSIVASDNTDEEFNRIDRIFVERIYELLRRVNESNDQKKRKIQCYVMDDYERSNIENTLYNMLENIDSVEGQDLLEKVMTILFWLQGERLVTDVDQEPEETLDNPITVLTSEISRLYVLADGVAYSLKSIASIFSPDFNFDDDKSNYFSVLTNVVEGTSILNAWKEENAVRKAQKLDMLGAHLRKRLFVESAIIAAVQKDNNSGIIHLSVWPAQYKMQKPKYPEYPEIARLDFENRYEQLLTYHQIRTARMAGIQNAIDNGTILWLEYTGNGRTYEILNSENYVGREWFSAWLCEDTPENRLQILLLRDTDYTASPYLKRRYEDKHEIKGTSTIFYPTDFKPDYNYTDDGSYATVDFTPKKQSGFKPEQGKKYLFFEVFSDANGDKTAKGIEKLIDRQELLNPRSLSRSTGLNFDNYVENICNKYWSPDGFNFSPSQKIAFIHLLEQKLNVLVGPPAAGKTDFIARALITMASYYKVEHKKNLKIMVTAMSHSAIENVLLKLDKMLKNGNPCEIKVYKAGRFDDEHAFLGKNVGLWEDKTVAGHLSENEIQIVGMTSWSVYKEFHDEKTGKMYTFDMIVMDEASQVRAMDAFLNLECSDENTRYLLVGDNDQLPPIIGGKYREIEGEKYIHGSIFHMYLSGLGDGHPDIVRLSDNFRMNGILCKYPSKAIYGPNYQAFNDSIKKQKITLAKSAQDSLIASLLDPEYPLVFCELSGIAREQHDAEVQLVTSLVHELWESQKNKETGNLASEDGNFWRDSTDGKALEGACGIITPHHEHINRLKTSISNDLGLDRKDIFIGTVDKLQGKERKTIIVSYGVSENEKIINESEFIFSSNRFNVSITRGKAKTIIFLSEAIAEPNITTNIMTANDKALKKGIDFIHGFSTYMRCEEEGENLIAEEYPYVVGEVSLKVWKKRLTE